MKYQVTTTDAKRARLWDHLFGVTALPVKQAKPRRVRDAGGGHEGFDLMVEALTPMQIARLASWASSETRLPYRAIHQMILDVGFVIKADETIEVTAVDEKTAVNFFLVWQGVTGHNWHRRGQEAAKTAVFAI